MNFTLPAASNFAAETDHILIALLVLSGGMLALVFGMMLTFAFRYRANSPLDRGKIMEKTWRLETAWTTAIMLGFFGLFYWGATEFVAESARPPPLSRSTSSASNGCGNSSIRAARRRSTSSTCRWASRCSF